MQVECAFFGRFREAVGEKSVRRETGAGTVGALLAELRTAYPDLDGHLLDGDDLAGSVAITVNGTHLQQLDGLETPLEDGDVVRLTQAIHGG